MDDGCVSGCEERGERQQERGFHDADYWRAERVG
jgi:hypothetical protein